MSGVSPWQQPPRPEPRIGDLEREGAAWALGEHFSVGRLTSEEHDERVALAWRARTHRDLAPLFADLPQPHGRPAPLVQPAAPAAPRPNRWKHVVASLLLVVAGVAFIADLPFAVALLVAAVVLVVHPGGGCGHRAPHRPRQR